MSDRCIDGVIWRHKPFPDDPDFEYAVGACERFPQCRCSPDATSMMDEMEKEP